jgi:mitochondrial fission protein ELM1
MTRSTSQTGSLAGRTAWVISDGKAGHEAQCLGVVEALGLTPEIKRVSPTGAYRWMAPWGPVAPRERFGRPGSSFEPPWPSLAFATGRTTIPYIRALRRRAGLATYTVVLMDPRTGAGSADLIWVPEHDRRRGSNVITTLAAPHRFSPSRLATLRNHIPPPIAALPSPRIACLIGGPNGDYRYTPGDEARLFQNLEVLAASGAGLMITPSRRTPARLRERISTMSRSTAALVWDGTGDNPYPDFLAHADHFFITADSVSMICEAAATGRPIHIFSPTGGSAKFDRFHAGLRTYGATRPLGPEVAALETWRYEPIHAAETIANEITRRWSRRAALLPGLVGDARVD